MAKPGGGPVAKAAPTGIYPKAHPIPQQFRDPTSTPLTTTLEAGKMNTFDYDIR